MRKITLPGLDQRRVAAGLSQRRLAKMVGVSDQTIRRLERGGDASALPLGLLANLAEALNTPLGDLLSAPRTSSQSEAATGPLNFKEARLLRHIATTPAAGTNLSNNDRQFILPALLRSGLVQVAQGQLLLHPDVEACLVPS